MSAGEQLERSVLEGKEREELHTIADALGLKPNSRTKKADLVASILRATGVETEAPAEDEAPKPRRRPAPRAKAAVNGSASSEVVGAAVAVEDRPADDGQGTLQIDEHAARREPDAAPAPPAVDDVPGEDDHTDADGAAADHDEDHQQRQHQQQASSARADHGEEPGDDGPSDHERSGGSAGDDGAQQGGRQNWDSESGNRRNRRRRGRDRDRTGSGGGGGGGGGGQGANRELQAESGEQPYNGDLVEVAGLLELRPEGFGFLRTKGYLAGPSDVYVSVSQVRRFSLRPGDHVEGASRPAGNQEKFPALLRIDKISGLTPDEARQRPKFEDLTPLFPDEKLRLEQPGDPANTTARIIDLICPIGKGQRGLIVSPPKAGKTTIMKQIAHSIEANNPDVHLMVLLVDERPEEVTDMRRSVKGEVVASTFDRPSEEHTRLAELAIERAKRLVEMGQDVVIILDGITRLARAYNLAAPATGRIMSGGVDSGALYPPKKFFGAARNVEEGGSLTILATALVETGSTMDTVIFEEFKGTGNMELRLDRRLAERRIYPAIDVSASSTRHEELLFDRVELRLVWQLRRVLLALGSEGSSANGLELLIEKIKQTRTNAEFLADIAKTPAPSV